MAGGGRQIACVRADQDMHGFRDSREMRDMRELLKTQREMYQQSARESVAREKDLRAALAQSKRDASQLRKRVSASPSCLYVPAYVCVRRCRALACWEQSAFVLFGLSLPHRM